MKHIYPQIYNDFRCVAADCPDSCCKDWDVVVDDESADFYCKLSGDFGELLNSKMTIDGDGDRIFVSEKGRCPFWNKDSLCDIYINLGEEHLCKTCREFPRLTQDYSAFAEHMLSFACPEAARLMLSADTPFANCICKHRLDNENSLEYDAEVMRFLLKARKLTADIFEDKSLSFRNKLIKSLALNTHIQNMLDDDNLDISNINLAGCTQAQSNCNKADKDFIFNLHSRLDIMNNEWRNKMCSSSGCKTTESLETDKEFCTLALYYIYRYYLGAIDSLDVLSTIKRIACAYVVISAMITFENAENDFDNRVILMQQYSKEVEHSYENSEMLTDEFIFNADFSAENLIDVIKSL